MSSSFSNNKNSANKEDDTSFYTFLAGILLVFIFYYFIVILKKIFYKIPFNDENSYMNCHCSLCKKRYEEFKSKTKRENINKKLYLNIFLFFFFLYLFIACCNKVQTKKVFDPFEILEISPTDSISEIKKSYKRLSLKYHPDKNRDDANAKDKFILINKAYKILTNEKAKMNYEKYGNPDGPGLITIGLALPLFLFQGQIGFYILAIISILLTIIFPIMFMKWSKEKNKYNDNGLLIQDLPLYYKYIDNSILITEIPFIIGMSYEFEKLNIKYNEENIKQNFNDFKKYFPEKFKDKEEIDKISMNNIFAIVVLYKHFLGEKISDGENMIIEKSIFLMDELIRNSFELNRIYEFNEGMSEFKKSEKYSKDIKEFEDYSIKKFDLNLILTLLKFRSRFFHETNIITENNELLLFPNNKNNIEIFLKNNYSSINNILSNKILEEENWFTKLDNVQDIKEVIKTLPKYNMEINIANNLYPQAGNLLTFNIKVKRGENIEGNNTKKELGFLHSNNYSNCFDENAYVIIVDKNSNRINYYEKIKLENEFDEKNIEYNMLTEKNNENNFEIFLISLTYPGICIKKNIDIDVKEENHLLKNFIKNRVKDLIPIEEFITNYGIDEENEELKDYSHEHND